MGILDVTARPALRPVTVPTAGRIRIGRRILLLGEVLSAYVPLVRQLRSNDLRAMTAASRAVSGPRASVDAGDQLATARRVGRIVNRTLRVLPTDHRCLIQALVTLRLLERRSIPTRVIIGVRGGASFGAHAWLELDGQPVLPAGAFEPIHAL